MRRPAGVQRRWLGALGNLAGGLAVTLAFMVAVELVLRLAGFERPLLTARFLFVDEFSRHGGIYREHPRLFWELEPGAVYPFGGDTPNALTFRGEPVERAKPPGTLRVATLGDSCTFGTKLELEESYPWRLERALETRLPGTGVEVVNAGVPGYSIHQGRITFEEKVLPLRPDVAVFYFGVWNDGTAATTAPDTEFTSWRAFVWDMHRRAAGLRTYQAMSLLVRRGDGPARLPDRAYLERRWKRGEPVNGYRVPVADFRETLRAKVERCRREAIHPIIVLPEMSREWIRASPRGGITEARRRLAETYRAAAGEVAERCGVDIVDLRPLFEELGHGPAFVGRDPIHPGPPGTLVLAEALGDLIAERHGAIEALEPSEPGC